MKELQEYYDSRSRININTIRARYNEIINNLEKQIDDLKKELTTAYEKNYELSKKLKDIIK